MAQINACNSCEYLIFDKDKHGKVVCWCNCPSSKMYGKEYPSTTDCESYEQYEREQ